jgi:hypothetical protein
MGVQRTMGDGGSPAHTYQGEFVRESVLRHDMGEVAVELVDEKPKEDRVARGAARVSEGTRTAESGAWARETVPKDQGGKVRRVVWSDFGRRGEEGG